MSLKCLVLAAFALLFSSSSADQKPRSINTRWNQWEIEYVFLQRWPWQTSPNVGVSFGLYRSYYEPCPSGGEALEGWMINGITGTKCGWIVPDNPVQCSQGMKSNRTDPIWKPTTQWFTCDSYPRAIDGERDVPEERKQLLKWRLFDLVERDPKSIPQPRPNEAREIPFKSAKIEIVNGVPIKQSTSSVPQLKVFSTILTVDKSMFSCGEGYLGPDGPQYWCQFNNSPALKCANIFSTYCSMMVNVTEGVKSISEFKSKFSN